MRVANVLVSEQGEILLGISGGEIAWDIPGGWVGNAPLEKEAKRLHLESTGMSLEEEPRLIGYSEKKDDDGLNVVTLYLLWKEWGGFPHPSSQDFLQFRWFPLTDPPSLKSQTAACKKFFTQILPESLGLLVA